MNSFWSGLLIVSGVLFIFSPAPLFEVLVLIGVGLCLNKLNEKKS